MVLCLYSVSIGTMLEVMPLRTIDSMFHSFSLIIMFITSSLVLLPYCL